MSPTIREAEEEEELRLGPVLNLPFKVRRVMRSGVWSDVLYHPYTLIFIAIPYQIHTNNAFLRFFIFLLTLPAPVLEAVRQGLARPAAGGHPEEGGPAAETHEYVHQGVGGGWVEG